MSELLRVENLKINFPSGKKTNRAVRGVSFEIEKGKTLGIVGESGCGKTVTAYSILNLVPHPGIISEGKIFFEGQDILQKNYDIKQIRGKKISMIFQEPMTSLNPVFTIGFQISEVIKLHLNLSKKKQKEYAIDLLDQVGIPNPSKRYNSYPHEFSGGMRQRVVIAMALAASPKLLIADEPTTALDVTIQAQILDLLLKIQETKKMSLLLISHDLGIVANIADNLAIMYAGEIVESGTTKEIFENPIHPYTRGLFKSIPDINNNDNDKLHFIPGNVPQIYEDLNECAFAPRCDFAKPECKKNIPLEEISNGRKIKCIRKGQI